MIVTIFDGDDILLFEKLQVDVAIRQKKTGDDAYIRISICVDKDDLPNHLTEKQKKSLSMFFEYLFTLVICGIVTRDSGYTIVDNVTNI